MTELQRRIVHLVKRAGPDGISGDDLFVFVYPDLDAEVIRYQGGRRAARGKVRQRTALKAIIWRINQALAQYGYRIKGSSCQGGWYWWEKNAK